MTASRSLARFVSFAALAACSDPSAPPRSSLWQPPPSAVGGAETRGEYAENKGPGVRIVRGSAVSRRRMTEEDRATAARLRREQGMDRAGAPAAPVVTPSATERALLRARSVAADTMVTAETRRTTDGRAGDRRTAASATQLRHEVRQADEAGTRAPRHEQPQVSPVPTNEQVQSLVAVDVPGPHQVERGIEGILVVGDHLEVLASFEDQPAPLLVVGAPPQSETLARELDVDSVFIGYLRLPREPRGEQRGRPCRGFVGRGIGRNGGITACLLGGRFRRARRFWARRRGTQVLDPP